MSRTQIARFDVPSNSSSALSHRQQVIAKNAGQHQGRVKAAVKPASQVHVQVKVKAKAQPRPQPHPRVASNEGRRPLQKGLGIRCQGYNQALCNEKQTRQQTPTVPIPSTISHELRTTSEEELRAVISSLNGNSFVGITSREVSNTSFGKDSTQKMSKPSDELSGKELKSTSRNLSSISIKADCSEPISSKTLELSQPLPGLTIEQVLQALQLGEFGPVFTAHSILLEDVLLLTKEDMREMGLPIVARNRIQAFQTYFQQHQECQVSPSLFYDILRGSYNPSLVEVLSRSRDPSPHSQKVKEFGQNERTRSENTSDFVDRDGQCERGIRRNEPNAGVVTSGPECGGTKSQTPSFSIHPIIGFGNETSCGTGRKRKPCKKKAILQELDDNQIDDPRSELRDFVLEYTKAQQLQDCCRGKSDKSVPNLFKTQFLASGLKESQSKLMPARELPSDTTRVGTVTTTRVPKSTSRSSATESGDIDTGRDIGRVKSMSKSGSKSRSRSRGIAHTISDQHQDQLNRYKADISHLFGLP